jgi:hypothetical protein
VKERKKKKLFYNQFFLVGKEFFVTKRTCERKRKSGGQSSGCNWPKDFILKTME